MLALIGPCFRTLPKQKSNLCMNVFAGTHAVLPTANGFRNLQETTYVMMDEELQDISRLSRFMCVCKFMISGSALLL